MGRLMQQEKQTNSFLMKAGEENAIRNEWNANGRPSDADAGENRAVGIEHLAVHNSRTLSWPQCGLEYPARTGKCSPLTFMQNA